MQEFDLEIRDRSGYQNLVADHLSHLENVNSDPFSINDSFPLDILQAVSQSTPWFAPIANYLVGHVFPPHFSKHYRDKLRIDSMYFIWDDPHLWRRGADQVIRRCMPEIEFQSILRFCHSYESGGHFGPQRIPRKILDCGLWWPTLFRDANHFCQTCHQC